MIVCGGEGPLLVVADDVGCWWWCEISKEAQTGRSVGAVKQTGIDGGEW